MVMGPTTTHPAAAVWLKRVIIRHPVAAFLGLVYGLSWPLLPARLPVAERDRRCCPSQITRTPFLPAGRDLRDHPPGLPRHPGHARARQGVRALRRRYTHWRVGLGWYLLALFALPITALVGASLWLGAGPLAAFADRWQLLFTVFLPEALVSVVLDQPPARRGAGPGSCCRGCRSGGDR